MSQDNGPEIEVVEIPEDDASTDVDREPLAPTEDDIEDGNHLGLVIDPDDDADTGARETYL